MSARLKLIIAVVVIAVLAIASMWGIFAPLFSEADAIPIEKNE